MRLNLKISDSCVSETARKEGVVIDVGEFGSRGVFVYWILFSL